MRKLPRSFSKAMISSFLCHDNLEYLSSHKLFVGFVFRSKEVILNSNVPSLFVGFGRLAAIFASLEEDV